MVAYFSFEFNCYNRMSCSGISNRAPSGHPAAEVLKFADDMCTYAFLDFIASQDCGLDGDASAGRGNQ